MRIALLCPTFPPARCGVGDYSSALTHELARQGHAVSVWTAESSARASGSSLEIELAPRPWNGAALGSLLERLQTWKPEAVLLQYTPLLLAPETRGLRPSLPIWISRLKSKLACPVAVVAHELNYPAEFSLRGLALGVPQLAQFLLIASAADQVFFTYDSARERTEKRLPWKMDRFATLTVGSNIPAHEALFRPDEARICREDCRARIGVSPQTPVLFYFGGFHPTHLTSHIFSALEAARAEIDPGTVLAFGGVDQERLEARARSDGFAHLAPALKGLGYLSPEDVSRWLVASDVVLSPFMDGISTRRGSAMAGFSHGRPVVTTRGWATSKRIPWEGFCRIVPADDSRAFTEAVLALLRDPSGREQLGKEAREHYRLNLSWDRIAENLISSLSEIRELTS